jgi:hypothetical protein
MEIAYPAWRISAKWNQIDYKNNSVGFKESLREGYFEVDKWWDKYRKKKLKDKEPIELVELKCELIGSEVWFLTWFAHKSLNYFDNEKEAFVSFEKWFNEKGYEFKEIDYDPERHNNEIGCPMGADEKWRWKFCGCKECKKLGITIINH